jgi:hypothetical protein
MLRRFLLEYEYYCLEFDIMPDIARLTQNAKTLIPPRFYPKPKPLLSLVLYTLLEGVVWGWHACYYQKLQNIHSIMIL